MNHKLLCKCDDRLKEMDTFSGETNLLVFPPPSEKGSTLKGKNLVALEANV